MNKTLILALGLLLGSFLLSMGGAVYSETVKIPAGQQGESVWSGKTPIRGSSKEQVEAEFGTPDSKIGPNGDPPIYYWEYPDFTVYFESDFVIHAVIKHRPKT